jgi:signal transduction histidine kinase
MTQTPDSPVRPSPASPHSEAQVQASRLRWLIRLRWLYVVGASVLAASVSLWQPHEWATYLLAAAAGLLLAYNLLFSALTNRLAGRPGAAPVAHLARLAEIQIALDLVVLFALMHITGGAYSVLLAVVVFHLAVAASLQTPARAYLHAALATVLFAALVLFESWVSFWQGESLPGQRPLLPAMLGNPPFPIHVKVPIAWVAMSQIASFLVVGGCFFGTVRFTDAILERLRAINRRLGEANRKLSGLGLTKSRFLRISSHQLRGPLAAIHSLVTAAEEVGGFNARQLDLMNKVRNRSDVMMTQLDEMLALSTIKEDAGESVPDQAVDVAQAVRATVANFDQEARQKGLKLSCSCDAEVKVWAWEDAVETVMEHLLSNAVHYTPSGGSVRIRIAPGPQQTVQVEIADTGIGIPAEQQDRLFHEFFRATNARQVCGGTGLGLSIAQAVVERLGGRISIVSKLGEGTQVSLSLPLTDPKDILNDTEENHRHLAPDTRTEKGTEAHAPANPA